MAQCTDFIKSHNLIANECYDTAGAVKLIAESECLHTACIASRRAASIYGMNIEKENIQNNKINLTRFLLIKKSVSCNNLEKSSITDILINKKIL